LITSVNDWVAFLKNSNSAMGFPLVVFGLALMLFGWRMWKLTVVLAYALIGAALGSIAAGQSEQQAIFAAVGAVVLAAVSVYPVHLAVAVLGGLIGAGISHFYLSRISLNEIMQWSLCGASFVAFAGFSFLGKQRVVIFVTAFLGAVLLMSGLAAWVMSARVFYGTVQALAGNSIIVVPFLLIVPTVMSSFYQIAEVRRLQVEL
jgi:hypothetical protein